MTPSLHKEWDLPDSLKNKPGFSIWEEGKLGLKILALQCYRNTREMHSPTSR